MAGTIHIVNLKTNDCSTQKNFFYCGRSKSRNPLGNPFTHNGVKSSLAKLSFKTREEAINAYEKYFDAAYGTEGYEDLTNAFDEIYSHYKNGEDVYLGCWCHPMPCHCSIIANRLQRKLIKEAMAAR